MPQSARKQYPKRNNKSKKAPTNKQLNKKIKNIENNLIELKYSDTLLASTASTALGVLQLLNDIAPGTGATQHVGTDVVTTSLQFKYVIRPSTSALETSVMRVMLFWDRQTNGAAPSIAISAGGTALLDDSVITSLVLAPYSAYTNKRFKVLYDKLHDIHPDMHLTEAAGSVVTTLQKRVDKFKVFKLKRTIKFDNGGGGSGVGGIETNSLYCLFISGNVANHPSLQIGSRLFFRDA